MTADKPDSPDRLERRDWTPDSNEPAAHPNSRLLHPDRAMPHRRRRMERSAGVPISAILFGGRRASTIPLITESLSWQHGVFLASTLSSETTAAATGTVGVVRRDPMAMLPFLGYHVGDYLQHWLDIGAKPSHRSCRRSSTSTGSTRRGRQISVARLRRPTPRVLKWALQRIEGTADAVVTAIG